MRPVSNFLIMQLSNSRTRSLFSFPARTPVFPGDTAAIKALSTEDEFLAE